MTKTTESPEPAVRPTLDEILAPFREQVTNSGISDDELDRLFSEAREIPKRQ